MTNTRDIHFNDGFESAIQAAARIAYLAIGDGPQASAKACEIEKAIRKLSIQVVSPDCAPVDAPATLEDGRASASASVDTHEVGLPSSTASKDCVLKRFAISKEEMKTISEDEVLRRLTKAGFNVRSSQGIQFSDASGEMVYTQGGGCQCPKHVPAPTQTADKENAGLKRTVLELREEVATLTAIITAQAPTVCKHEYYSSTASKGNVCNDCGLTLVAPTAPAADPKTDALANFRLTLEIIAQRMTFDVHGGTVKDGWEIAAQYARNALAAFPADVTRPVREGDEK